MMPIIIEQATVENQKTIQNLARFYIYDMSRECGGLKGWETPPDGQYACFDLSRYWCEKDRIAFLIKVDQELAGFALVNQVGTTPEVDWNLAEFFVVAKFQRQSVGRYAAQEIFNRFPGIWEVALIPENQRALAFWGKVIPSYSSGNFEKKQKIVSEPTPHPMLVFQFRSPPIRLETTSPTYTMTYQESVSAEEEAILMEGLNCEAQQIKNMDPILPFGFFIRDCDGKIWGGLKGASCYGCMYIDYLWVSANLRKKGWGIQLMEAAEKLAQERKCHFLCLTTMDWEALRFYQKLGYSVEYTREGFYKNSKMFMLRKNLEIK